MIIRIIYIRFVCVCVFDRKGGGAAQRLILKQMAHIVTTEH